VPVTSVGLAISQSGRSKMKFGANFVVLGEGNWCFRTDRGHIRPPTEQYRERLQWLTVIQVPGQHLREKLMRSLSRMGTARSQLYAKTPSFATSVAALHDNNHSADALQVCFLSSTMGKVFRRERRSRPVRDERARFRMDSKDGDSCDCSTSTHERMYAILTGIRDRNWRVKLHFSNGSGRYLNPRYGFSGRRGPCRLFRHRDSSPVQKMIHKI